MWRASCRRRKQQCDEARTEKLLNCSSIHVPPSAVYSLPSHYYNEDGPVLLNGFRDDSFLRGRAVPEMKKPTGWGAGGRIVLFKRYCIFSRRCSLRRRAVFARCLVLAE